MQQSTVSLLIAILCSFLVLSAQASDEDMPSMTQQNITNKLNQVVPNLVITQVKASRIDGLFEVELAGGERIFSNADASHFIVGDLFQATSSGIVNLTDEDRNTARAIKLTSIADENKIIFTPEQKKHSVSIFTDVDCIYCQKLHASIQEYLDLGIEIKYLAFPRAGVGSDSYKKIVSAWCADDKQQALTRLKLGENIEEKTCDNSVAEQYALGKAIGVQGTPAIVLESGKLVPGFIPAHQLVKILDI